MKTIVTSVIKEFKYTEKVVIRHITEDIEIFFTDSDESEEE